VIVPSLTAGSFGTAWATGGNRRPDICYLNWPLCQMYRHNRKKTKQHNI